MVLDNIIEGINAGFYDAFESIVAAHPNHWIHHWTNRGWRCETTIRKSKGR